MNIIIKYKNEILISAGLVILYLITRLVLLSDFPIFTDEAIYVRWSQIASNDASWRFISLTDGKQPMLIWMGMLMVRLFEDSLLAVRLVSVFMGFMTMIGLWFLTYELFKNKKIAFITSLFYIFYPFAVVHDRLAIYDSTVAAFAIWATYFSILLVRRIRLDIALILSFILGGGLLTKSSEIFSVLLLPFTLILFDFKNKKWKINLFKWGAFALTAVIISQVFYNLLRLSPFFHIISQKNTIFVYPFSEWLSHPFTFFFGNLMGLSGWLYTYLTPFYIFLIIVSFITIKKFPREKILLFLYFLLPFIALALFGKVIFPRFIFFMSITLLPLAAFGAMEVIDYLYIYFKKRKIDSYLTVVGLVLLFFILYPASVSLQFIFNPMEAKIASGDKTQYVSGWASGYGVKESIDFFEKESRKGKIFIATQGDFGLLPAALDIKLGNNPNITTKGYWPTEDNIPEDVKEMSSKMPTYFVFYQPCPSCPQTGIAPKSWNLKLLKQIDKGNNVFYSIYSVEE